MEDSMRMTKGMLPAVVAALTIAASPALAQNEGDCSAVPTYAQLKAAMELAAGPASGIVGANRGFGLEMWGTVVNRDGVVCAVVFTGDHRGDQWPGSRVISAQKANTANAFSLNGLALSTANLYRLVQPGVSLFGLQESNPVDTQVAYQGPAGRYGQVTDPMVGRKIGGVNVFGGGLALYRAGVIVGAIGVSGDTSCADHNIAWKARQELGLNGTPTSDNIAYGAAAHPQCLGGETPPAP
jgi:uncharacterized protein GlcG (DUF336 family)